MAGASLRTSIFGFIANESARAIWTTALRRAVHDQFSLPVSEYENSLAKGRAWGGFTEIAAFALKSGCIVEVHEKLAGNFKQLL